VEKMKKIPLFLKNYKEEAFLTFGFVLLAVLFNNYRIFGDANYYYAFNELLISGFCGYKVGSHIIMQFGAALFYLPFLLVAKMILEFDMFPLPASSIHGILITLGNNIYASATLILLVRILKKLNLSVLGIPLVFFSTPYFLFAIPLAGNTHIIDAFLFTLMIYIFISYQSRGPWHVFVLGVLTALSIYVRYFNFVILIILAGYFLIKERKQLWYYLSGAASLLWFLPISLWLLNGNLFDKSLSGLAAPLVKSSPIKGVPLFPPYALKLLVHPLHGLFIWSPLTLLSLNGLILYFRERRDLSLLFLGWFAGLVWFYGYFYYWHAGWSFSQRYLLGLFPVFVIGYAYFVKVFPKLGISLGILFTLYSIFLFLNWGTFMHGSNGVPQDIIKVWQGKNISINYYFQRLGERLEVKKL
jgi:hypothetical protein